MVVNDGGVTGVRIRLDTRLMLCVGVGVYSCLPSLSLIDSFIFPDH